MARAARVRADLLLVERGLAGSRERARALILAGQVRSGSTRVDKAGMRLARGAPLEVRAMARFVSRGGEKLEGALAAFGIDAAGRVCVDIGASTGGFTDCLLQRGAARVVAVDVGYGQLDPKLRGDRRVRVLERTNARRLRPGDLPGPADLVTMDVSFISAALLAPVALGLLRPGGALIVLVKPQFEVGRGEVGRGGVVRDAARQRRAVAGVARAALAAGAALRGLCPSPLLGPKGNREFFLHFTAGGPSRELADVLASVFPAPGGEGGGEPSREEAQGKRQGRVRAGSG
jgi:23S rRNA (cytidine1920-2'-O)/16S rRNA (cytidine1409-2'-O)-methyltransferase